MNRIVNFVREKAFVLILLGSILAAVGTGIWAIRTVQQNLTEYNLQEESGTTDFDGFEDGIVEGDSIWDEPADMVTDEMNGEVPMETPTPTATAQPLAEDAIVTEPVPPVDGQTPQELPPESSTDLSGGSFSLEPSTPSVGLEPQSSGVSASFVLPVSGSVIQVYSGDELVYNETLGDWRTHNGVDYAAALGEEVIAPVAGELTAIYTDGNWGGVVELTDSQGYIWRFCGVEGCTLSVGETVDIGAVLGSIGIIGAESAAEPHLHLEILKDGDYQDPSDHLK